MSHLTDQEVTAGVSRRALETLSRHSPNGQKPPAKPTPPPPTSTRRVQRRVSSAPAEIELRRVGPHPPAIELPSVIAEPITPRPEPGSLAEHLANAKASGMAGPQKIAVLDTWDRSLDILNIDGWSFRIRDIHHLHKIQVDEIVLDRVTLTALGRKITEALAVGSDPQIAKVRP